MGARRWSESEIELLTELAGDVPHALLMWHLRKHWRERGLKPRSANAVGKQAGKLGLLLEPVGKWVNTTVVCELLCRHRRSVHEWAEKGYVRKMRGAHSSALLREDLIRLAKRKPHLFAGATRGNLYQLLEDEQLAEWIAKQHPQHPAGPGWGKRVRWRGRVYASVVSVAEVAHLHPHTIRVAMREGRAAGGEWFEAV